MRRVTRRYGTSHLAFIIVPLVCACFIDLVNALLTPMSLGRFQVGPDPAEDHDAISEIT